MAGSTIGIKIADGSYYPVLAEGFTGTKRLTLTTVKDDQDRVQIDLYRGEGQHPRQRPVRRQPDHREHPAGARRASPRSS